MTEPLAYLNGKFIPASQLVIPVYDGGFVQGTTVAEQLRTFGGKLFRLEEHLARLFRSLDILGVDPHHSRQDFARLANELVATNHARLSPGDDLGLSIFVTPGPYSTMAPPGEHGPTIGLHTYPLPFHQWVHLYEQGQGLVTTETRHVPTECWPVELKCRSRMHYFLADREAREREAGSRALLLDLEGHVTEASTANVVVLRRGEGLISPPRERILSGISVAVLEELAGKLGLPFVHRDLSVAEVASADEVMLTSTSPCVWPCVRLNGRPIGAGIPGETARRLLAAWSDLVGLDVAKQAARFSNRS